MKAASMTVRQTRLEDSWRRQLEASIRRVDELIEASLDDEALHELVVLWNNAEYLLLYAEATDLIERPRLDVLQRCLAEPERRRRVAAAMRRTQGATPDAERLRIKLLEASQASGERIEMTGTLEPLFMEADSEDQSFLRKLGVEVPTGTTAEAAYLRLFSDTQASGSRKRLSRVWASQRARSSARVVEAVDAIVARRRDAALVAGRPSPADQTFERFGITKENAESFLGDYLIAALEDRAMLDDEVAAILGIGNSTIDLPRVLQQWTAQQRLTFFEADHILNTAHCIAARNLGIDMAWRRDEAQPYVEVSRHGTSIGELRIDMVGPKSAAEASTPCSPGQATLPIASISFQYSVQNGVRRMTARAVQTMLHELGHALNHILLRSRMPSTGGLDYLPLERLDLMSMWFEQWLLHPDVVRCATDPVSAEHTLRMSELLHRRTLVERGAYAAFDLELHSQRSGSAAEAFTAVVDRHGLSDQIALADMLPYLTWPMQQRNPGAEVGILWNWASAAVSFRPYKEIAVEDIRQPESSLLLALDPDLPTPPVPARMAMEFLRR